MKKTQRFLALTAAALFTAVSVAGCGTSSSSSGSAGNTGKADKFYIGGIGPTTGDAAVYGTAVMNAAQIAADEINAAGGINGYEIEFRFEDDVADPEESVSAYNVLKDWGMQILMGTVTSGACATVVSYTEDDNMFQLTPSASSTDVIEGDNVFQVCFTDPNQGSASAIYIGEHSVADKVGIIYDSSDIYSSGIYEKFVEEAANQDFEIVSTQSFTGDTNTDFSVQVQACIDAGANLIFLPIYYSEASLIINQAQSVDYKGIFFGCDGLDGILSVLDKEKAEGIMLLTPFSADSEDEKVAAFVTSYKDKFNDTPNQFAADAYDAMYILKAAMEDADVTPSDSVSDICEALKASIVKVSYDGVTGAGMSWISTGEVQKAPAAVVIKDGTYVSAE